ncbi:PAS domain-containing methyl-accepting chemotaxis protein [Halomonas chromatireducens]|uniref:Methyl-accepting chemotaxis protein II n=1 Tax=Halomonas chromatireducens TaxID=507626 RepID=A0A120JWF0_9GAMM|nr:PAS domain-containing methyl-accepting chemotaxis protein [Halomonas chromatireducens]AMD01817.1 Methyl-accepting chemotaxis protein II [Halomonas chromatireducens]
MRDNQPVTQREYKLSDQHLLITRTDLEGRITYANAAFVEVSGFTHEELIGAHHNLVRHPDMPQEAFADLWQTLKQGETWQGVIKNRRKNGDHYWVQATVTPILEEGKCLGYTSVRVKADPATAEKAAHDYARLREGRTRHLAFRQGQLVRRGPLGLIARLNLHTIRAKLVMMTLVPVLLLMLSGAAGLYGLQVSGDRVAQLNNNGVQDIADLQRIDQLLSQLMIDLERPVRNPRALRLEQIHELDDEVNVVIERVESSWESFLEGEDATQPEIASLDGQLEVAVEEGIRPTMLALIEGSGFAAYEAFNDVLRAQVELIGQSINVLVEDKLIFANALAEEAAQGQALMLKGQVIAVSLGVAFLIMLGLWTMASITRPLRRAVDFTLQVASGNLAVRSPEQRRDEVGILLKALNMMRKSLYTTTHSVQQGIEVVTPASRSIARGNEDLSARTEQQAASLQETASSMEEMTTTVQQNTDNARQASGLALDNAGRVRDTGELMHGVVKTMERITASSNKMTDIINVIDGIAFQTNILALNASVEAARAGEQGRGFAVVAGEVRSLAGRSADAAKEIRQLIDGSSSEIKEGAAQVQKAESAMAEVVSASTRVNDIMGEITAASEEQSSGIGQINQAITEMDQVTQQNAERVQQSARAASDLQYQAEQLAQAIRVFRLRGAGPEQVEAIESVQPAARAEAPRANVPPLQHDPRPVKSSPSKQGKAASSMDEEWETF